MNGYIIKIEDGQTGHYLLARKKNPKTGIEEIGFGKWNGNPYDLAYFATEQEAQTAYSDISKKSKLVGVPVILKVATF